MKVSEQYIRLSKEPTLTRIDKIIELVKTFFLHEDISVLIDISSWLYAGQDGCPSTRFSLYILSDRTSGHCKFIQIPVTADSWHEFLNGVNEWLTLLDKQAKED